MSSVLLELDAIYKLAEEVMTVNGCDPVNAAALADIMTRAERDGSHSHGLFRVPGYVKALRSGKVDGRVSTKMVADTNDYSMGELRTTAKREWL